MRKALKFIRRATEGFTLIELLVTIGIVSLLASLLVANVRIGRMRGRDARRKADLRQTFLALQLYYDEFGNYPVTDDSSSGGGGGGGGGGKGKKKGWLKNGKSKGSDTWQFSTDSDFWIGCNECFGNEDVDSLRLFLNAVPRDPLNNDPDPRITGNYSYGYYSQSGEDYELIAQLEEHEDSNICAVRCWNSHEQDEGKAWCAACPNPDLGYSDYLYTDH